MQSTIKTSFNGDCRRYQLSGTPTFETLRQHVEMSYKLTDFSITYEDSEEDVITISTDNELVEAISLATAAKKPLKLLVTDKGVSKTEAKAVESAPIKEPVSAAVSTPTPPQTPNPAVSAPSTPPSTPTPTPQAPEMPSCHDLFDLALKFVSDSAIQRVVPNMINVVFDGLSKAGCTSQQLVDQLLTIAEVKNHECVQRLLPFVGKLNHYLDQLLPRVNPLTVLSLRPFIPMLAGLAPTLPMLLQQLREKCRFVCNANGDVDIDADIEIPEFLREHVAALDKEYRNRTNPAEATHVWTHVSCDGCNQSPLTGPRFKCTVCEDFDFCAACQAKKEHPHAFQRVPVPSAQPDEMPSLESLFQAFHPFGMPRRGGRCGRFGGMGGMGMGMDGCPMRRGGPAVHCGGRGGRGFRHHGMRGMQRGANANVSASSNGQWPTVSCDGCGAHPLVGVRYKCIVCDNFDLCEPCEQKAQHPADHALIKMRPNVQVAHMGIHCDGCGKHPIMGIRYKCAVCSDYDLCEECEAKRTHPADHPLIMLRQPKQMPRQVSINSVDSKCPSGDADAKSSESRRAGCPWVQSHKVEFLNDVNVKDGMQIEAGSKFTKTWSFINTGLRPWAADSRVAFAQGHEELFPCPKRFFEIPVAAPGATVQVSVDLQAPSQTGRYRAYFNLFDGARKFGPQFWVDIEVISAEKKLDVASAVTAPAVAAPAAHDTQSVHSDHSDNWVNVPSRPQSPPMKPVVASVAVVPIAAADNDNLNTANTAKPVEAPVSKPAQAVQADAPEVKMMFEVPKPTIAAPAAAPATPKPAAPVAPAAPAVVPVPLSKYPEQMQSLANMGFQNRELNEFLLEKNSGNLQRVCDWLIENLRQ